MKNVYIIGGTMGVGKTAVCMSLNKKLRNSVFLDGDWCWCANPFHVTEETKEMVIKNICFLLNSFIHCSAYDNVIFCWVMHEQSIIDCIIGGLDKRFCNIKLISLICNEAVLKERLNQDIRKGIRSEDIIERSTERISLYKKLNTLKIDTTNKTAEIIANEIKML